MYIPPAAAAWPPAAGVSWPASPGLVAPVSACWRARCSSMETLELTNVQSHDVERKIDEGYMRVWTINNKGSVLEGRLTDKIDGLI